MTSLRVQARHKSWLGRIGFILEVEIEGIPVRIADEYDTKIAWRLSKALALIKASSKYRLKTIRRDLTGGIVVFPNTTWGVAQFNSGNYSCEMRPTFARTDASICELAATVVHEAAHARLWRAGLRYDEPMRFRIEKICIARELAFANDLIDCGNLRAQILEQLSNLDANYFTDDAFQERYLNYRLRMIRSSRKLGFPGWLIRFIGGVGKFSKRIRLRLRGR